VSVRIHRIYCKSVSEANNVFDLDQSQSIHLIKVLRLKIDEEVDVFDGKGSSATCRISKISRSAITLERFSSVSSLEQKEEKIICIIPFIKKDNFHFMLQKLTEIGVSDFMLYKPDLIDQSIARKDILKLAEKAEEVVISACKQCGSNFLPTISVFENLKDTLNILSEGISIYAFDVDALVDFKTEELIDELSISVITGPESGFSEEEKTILSNNGVKIRLIGRNVLRAETAPLVISTLIQNHFGRI
jgi:16S rRNA (uracil1498-N3)-methyltransferase|tara:strand:+ start:30 stop:770 length:741 start_codon:yes stop_codon:yes gene_type:complete